MKTLLWSTEKVPSSCREIVPAKSYITGVYLFKIDTETRNNDHHLVLFDYILWLQNGTQKLFKNGIKSRVKIKAPIPSVCFVPPKETCSTTNICDCAAFCVNGKWFHHWRLYNVLVAFWDHIAHFVVNVFSHLYNFVVGRLWRVRVVLEVCWIMR